MSNGQHATQETATERIFHAIRQATLYIAIAGVAAAIVGIVATEAIAAALTRSLPGGPTHIAALVVGLLLGYGAAATATIWALITGLAETIRAIAGDLEQAGQRVVHELETLAGIGDGHSPTGTQALAVLGSTVRHEQPTTMRGVMSGIVAPPPSVVMSAGTQPVAPSDLLSAPLVPTTK